MALIKCPSCGKDVSDKAITCPACGAEIVQVTSQEVVPTETLCVECGSAIPNGATTCPNCGCPIEATLETTSRNEPQKVEITSISVKKSTKKIIIAVIAAVVVIAALFTVIKVSISKKAEQQAATQLADYKQNLSAIRASILLSASEAETACNLIHSVWYNSIYEKKDSKTDKYTRKNNGTGSFYDDFNDALANLFSDSSFKTTINNIKKSQDSISTNMKGLINPPDEYKEAYAVAKDLYDAYTKLSNLATNPTGSLSSFTSSFNEADDDTLKYYKSLGLYVD